MRYVSVNCDQHTVTFVWEENGKYSFVTVVEGRRLKKYIAPELETIRTPVVFKGKGKQISGKTREVFLDKVLETFIEITNCDCVVGITSTYAARANDRNADITFESINKIWDYADENKFNRFSGTCVIDIKTYDPEKIVEHFPKLSKYVIGKTHKEYLYDVNYKNWKNNNEVINFCTAFFHVEDLKKDFEQFINSENT
jgi:hypothetical protein